MMKVYQDSTTLLNVFNNELGFSQAYEEYDFNEKICLECRCLYTNQGQGLLCPECHRKDLV